MNNDMMNEQEIYYAIKEAISVMTTYDTGEDFALVSSLNRLHELEQKLNIASVVRPEVESAKEGELLPAKKREANKRAGFWCQNEMYGNVKCDVVCKHCKGYGG